MEWKQELLQIIKILKDNGVEVISIPTRIKDANGKRQYVTLKDITQQRSDIETIISQNGLDINFDLGKHLKNFKGIYNGSYKGTLSEEQRRTAEELGIVKKQKNDRQKPLKKGWKISQFHVDIVRDNIDKMLSGEISNADMIRIINERATQSDETQVLDNGTIRRIVSIVLAEEPEKLQVYEQMLSVNARKNLKKGYIATGNQQENVNRVIDEYLTRYLKGEITLDTIVEELHASHSTVNRIIIEYYTNSGNTEGLKLYEMKKKENKGTSIEQRETARSMRQEIGKYDVVSNAEFLLLSEEEQDRQILMKFRKEKLKEERRLESGTRVISEEATKTVIKRIKEYFRTKNDCKRGNENFSEQDIRYIIFRYPTILGRDAQTLDEKFDVLTSYDEIDMQTACGMIKTFPAVIGYSPERTKAQLDLLKKENLMDYVISTPSGMMRSINLMYALIQYAKQRHGTTDLSNVGRSNIFMSNGSLKRVYGVTYDKLKELFPYEENRDEEDVKYNINGQDIVKATAGGVDVAKADEAFDIVTEVCYQVPNKGGK